MVCKLIWHISKYMFARGVPGTLPFVRGINLTTRKAVYVRRHGARNRRCYVTMIMRLTKEFTYDYNLNTDSLQELITYNTIE